MKKKLLTLLVIGLLCYNSQAQKLQTLENAIAVLNAKLPMSLGPSGEVQAMALEGKTLKWDIVVNDLGKMVGTITPETYKDNFLTMLPTGFLLEPESARFYQLLVEYQIGLRLVVTSEVSGKSTVVNITTQELTNMLNSEPDFQKIIHYQVKNIKASFPMQANHMTFTDCELKSGYMVTTVIVDESQSSMELIEQRKQSMKQQMAQMVSQRVDLPLNLNLIFCYMAGYGFAYDYIGATTKKRVRIAFLSAEIAQMLASEEDNDDIGEVEEEE